MLAPSKKKKKKIPNPAAYLHCHHPRPASSFTRRPREPPSWPPYCHTCSLQTFFRHWPEPSLKSIKSGHVTTVLEIPQGFLMPLEQNPNFLPRLLPLNLIWYPSPLCFSCIDILCALEVTDGPLHGLLWMLRRLFP